MSILSNHSITWKILVFVRSLLEIHVVAQNIEKSIPTLEFLT